MPKNPLSLGEEADCPVAIGKNVSISIPFLWSTEFMLTLIKSRKSCGKFKNAQWFQPYYF